MNDIKWLDFINGINSLFIRNARQFDVTKNLEELEM